MSICLLILVFGLAAFKPCIGSKKDLPKAIPLQARLQSPVPAFDAAGRPLVELVLDLAFTYHVPLGLEYVDGLASRRPIRLKLNNQTVGSVLATIVAQLPEYRMATSRGLVEVYSPQARQDPANLLNRRIPDFEVNGVDTHQASADLACSLSRLNNPRVACFFSIAPGQWGPLKISLHARNEMVYEILNAIVVQNGAAAWTVLVPSNELSRPQGSLWYIYPLDSSYKAVAVERLKNLYPVISTSRNP